MQSQDWAADPSAMIITMIFGVISLIVLVFWIFFPLLVNEKLKRISQQLEEMNSRQLSGADLMKALVAIRQSLDKIHDDLRATNFDSTVCAACGKEFEYPTRMQGKDSSCPHCGIDFTLPP